MSDERWADARRLEAWAGEVRVNLLRLIGIILFYGRHLVEWALAPRDAPIRGTYQLPRVLPAHNCATRTRREGFFLRSQ